MEIPSAREMSLSLVRLFYPRLCEGCDRPLVSAERVLCVACDMELPETAYHHIADNETALRFSGRIPFAHATSFAYFSGDGLLRHLLHGLKYENKKETGDFLGRRFGQSLSACDWINSVDAIVPVPLHPAKQAKRGYNQSIVIADGMSGVLGIPVNNNILCRTRDTETQTNKSRTERIDNMADAFKLKENTNMAGKHILLCDDVLTTGATLEACALAFMTEKTLKISLCTIGIAVS